MLCAENMQHNLPSVLSSFQRKWMFGLMGVVHLVACLSLKWHLASSKFLMRVPIFLLSDFSFAPSPPFQGPGITNRSQECPTFTTLAHWAQKWVLNGHVKGMSQGVATHFTGSGAFWPINHCSAHVNVQSSKPRINEDKLVVRILLYLDFSLL